MAAAGIGVAFHPPMRFVGTSSSNRCRFVIKILGVIIVIAMIIHLVRPLGLPGLKRRADVWKIAVGFIAVMMAAVLVRPG